MDDHLIDRVLNLAVDIQQISAPPLGEGLRGEFVRDRFLAEGLSGVTTDKIGNVYARVPGAGASLPLVVTAHLDTVFPVGTDLKVRRQGDKIYGPGIGDNSLGVAGLFGLLWGLTVGQEFDERVDIQLHTGLPGDLWLVANVGEEGLGDLRGMRAVVDRFGDQVLAYIVLEGMALGQIYHRALGVQRYRISVQTMGGHSWVDFGQPSAINELAMLVTRLTALPLPEQPRTSLNVGVVLGGTSVNTIAARAQLELDLRSVDRKALDLLVKRVEALVESTRKPGVEVARELIGQRPAGSIPQNHPLVLLAKRCLLEQGVRSNLAIGSTDANIPLSRGIPAVCLGLSTGSGAHTLNEYIYTQPLAKGLGQLVSLVRDLYEEL